jgi:hypothetical protein
MTNRCFRIAAGVAISNTGVLYGGRPAGGIISGPCAPLTGPREKFHFRFPKGCECPYPMMFRSSTPPSCEQRSALLGPGVHCMVRPIGPVR